MDFQGGDFGLFRRQVDRFPWGPGLKDSGSRKAGHASGGAGAGCPHVLKDEPAGKKTSMAEQRALAGTQETIGKLMACGRRDRQLRRATGMS